MLIPDRNGVAGRHKLRFTAESAGLQTVRLTSGPQVRVKPIPALGVSYLPMARLDVRKRQRLWPQWPLGEHRRVLMNPGWLQIHRLSLDLGVQQGWAFRPVV
jgi:hypothetical protein